MFNSSKYTKIYYRIITRSLSRINLPGMEKHHIIPRAMGGNNSKSNLAHLTIKEHRLCHLLLTKMVIDPKHKISMYCAAWRMSTRFKTIGLSKGSYYVFIREQVQTINKNKVVSAETREKIRKKRALQKNVSNQYLSGNQTESPRKGNNKDTDAGYKSVSEKLKGREITWNDKLSASALLRPKCSCIKCKRTVTAGYNSDSHFLACFGN